MTDNCIRHTAVDCDQCKRNYAFYNDAEVERNDQLVSVDGSKQNTGIYYTQPKLLPNKNRQDVWLADFGKCTVD